jgi:hypothetical protein
MHGYDGLHALARAPLTSWLVDHTPISIHRCLGYIYCCSEVPSHVVFMSVQHPVEYRESKWTHIKIVSNPIFPSIIPNHRAIMVTTRGKKCYSSPISLWAKCYQSGGTLLVTLISYLIVLQKIKHCLGTVIRIIHFPNSRLGEKSKNLFRSHNLGINAGCIILGLII